MSPPEEHRRLRMTPWLSSYTFLITLNHFIANVIEQATPPPVSFNIPPTIQRYGIDRQRRAEAVNGRLATMVTLLLLLGVYTLIASQPS
jgi:hypothetical protein